VGCGHYEAQQVEEDKRDKHKRGQVKRRKGILIRREVMQPSKKHGRRGNNCGKSQGAAISTDCRDCADQGSGCQYAFD
jgi:hypothetical protein